MAPANSSGSSLAAPSSASVGAGGSESPASSSVAPVSLASVPVAPPDRLIQYPEIAAEHVHAGMDEGPVRLVEGDDRYLHTLGLVTCTGIAVSGVYPPPSPTSPPGTRYDRFLLHTSELEWESQYDALEKQVVDAINIGLHDLQIHVVAPHPETYRNQDYLEEVYGQQRRLLAKLRALLGPEANDQAARIRWYPYHQDSDDFHALIALYSDRAVLVNQRTFESCAWELEEKPWRGLAGSKMEMPTQPPPDWRTRVNIPWYVNRQNQAPGA